MHLGTGICLSVNFLFVNKHFNYNIGGEVVESCDGAGLLSVSERPSY